MSNFFCYSTFFLNINMNNNANTLSTTVRGANFEKNVYKKLRNMKLHVTQTG